MGTTGRSTTQGPRRPKLLVDLRKEGRPPEACLRLGIWLGLLGSQLVVDLPKKGHRFGPAGSQRSWGDILLVDLGKKGRPLSERSTALGLPLAIPPGVTFLLVNLP